MKKSVKKFLVPFLISLILITSACNGSQVKKEKEDIRLYLYMDYSKPVSERVEDLLSRMTLNEISELNLGSILHGGSTNPSPNKPEGWLQLYNEAQEYALKTRLQIPLLYGIDAVHGNARTEGAVIFPHNIGLGAGNNPDLVEEIGRITAAETRATGVHWTFSPCIAVPQDFRWGRMYEGFSEDSDITSSLGAALIKGLQGENLSDNSSIAACAKHYAGDGGTTGGTDRGNTQMTEEEFRQVHLAPYIAAVDQGVKTIMASFNSFNGVKMHGSSYWLTDVLKNELGFKGVLVSDWEGIRHLPASSEMQFVLAVNAGIDLIMLPDYAEWSFNTLKAQVEKALIPMERIDDAVRRILTLKFELGLFENPLMTSDNLKVIGSAEHRKTARQAVSESLVLLKNEKDFFPLNKDGLTIALVGNKAADSGALCGGWTLVWQGRNGSIPGGTSLLDAFKAAVGSTEIIYSPDGKNINGADIIIAAIGEDPYAEFKGDNPSPAVSQKDKTLINELAALDIPLAVILISGRPLLLNGINEDIDALAAVWLPGTEAQGITDVLFGDIKPSGKLPVTWPSKADSKQDPLFDFGYGETF